MDAPNSYKLQQKKLDIQLEQLNQLSRKEYYYKFKEGQHHLMFKVGTKPYTFRYFSNLTDLIMLVTNLIKYRMVEYEEPQD